MKGRPWTMFLLFMTLVFALTGWPAAADWPADVPEELVIKDEIYEKYKKGPVKFPHKLHYVREQNQVKCNYCHHSYEDGKNVWQQGDPVKKCSECHPFDKNKGKQFKMKMGTAFHNLCRNCHKKLKKGPKNCKECHQPLE